jgi:hypothetical protein
MNLVDSSGWLAYFADEPAADFFAEAIEELIFSWFPLCVSTKFSRWF